MRDNQSADKDLVDANSEEKIWETYKDVLRKHEIWTELSLGRRSASSYELSLIKGIEPRPQNWVEIELAKRIAAKHADSIRFEERDMSPEDLPQGSEIEYFWIARTVHKKEVDKLLEKLTTISKEFGEGVKELRGRLNKEHEKFLSSLLE